MQVIGLSAVLVLTGGAAVQKHERWQRQCRPSTLHPPLASDASLL